MSMEDIFKSVEEDLENYQVIWEAEEFLRQRFETPESKERERIEKEKRDEKSFNEFKRTLAFSLTISYDNGYIENILLWSKRLYAQPVEADNKWRELITDSEFERINLILQLENIIKVDSKKIVKF